MMAITKNRLGSGNAFNIAADAHLTMMAAQFLDLEPGVAVHTSGDQHLNSNLFEPDGYATDAEG
jgi:thymidylate synthase